MNSNNPLDIEDIFDAIMSEEETPSYEALQRWCSRYPEHREQISDFFATWSIQRYQNNGPEIDEACLSNRMVSKALQLMDSVPAPVATSSVIGNERLLKVVSRKGLSTSDVAIACRLDDTILLKLDRCLIQFESIPLVLVERLAEVIGCGLSELQRYLSSPPRLSLQHKSRKKPTARQESFLDALAKSELADSSKHDWETLAAGEPTSLDDIE